MIYSITNPPAILEERDEVYFTVEGKECRYVVHSDFLGCRDWEGNSFVFRQLGIDRYEIGSKAYEYITEDGGWPSSKGYDFEALTRLVWLVYGEILKGVEEEFEDFIDLKSLEIFFPRIPNSKDLQKEFQQIARKMAIGALA